MLWWSGEGMDAGEEMEGQLWEEEDGGGESEPSFRILTPYPLPMHKIIIISGSVSAALLLLSLVALSIVSMYTGAHTLLAVHPVTDRAPRKAP